MWYHNILEVIRSKILKLVNLGINQIDALASLYRVIDVNKIHIKESLYIAKLDKKYFLDFTICDVKKFASSLGKISKLIHVIANKINIKDANENLHKLQEQCNENVVILTSADR